MKQPSRTRLRLRLSACLPLLVALSACGESSYDIYMRGLKQSQEAQKVHCQMLWDEGSQAMVINSEKIIACKKANQEALSTIKQAQTAGFTGKDVDRTIADLEDKIAKLDSRLKVVGYMERQMELE